MILLFLLLYIFNVIFCQVFPVLWLPEPAAEHDAGLREVGSLAISVVREISQYDIRYFRTSTYQKAILDNPTDFAGKVIARALKQSILRRV